MLDRINIITRIIEKIKRYPATFESLKCWISSEKIDISDRTLYRYLEKIEEIILNDGRIISIDGEYNKKTWKFEYDNSKQDLEERDIKSFLLLKSFAPKSISSSRNDSIEKIQETIYKTQSKSKFEYNMPDIQMEQITTTNFNGFRGVIESDIMDMIIWTIQNGRKIKILSVLERTFVDSFLDSLPKVLLPMQLIYHKNSICLLSLEESTKVLTVLTVKQIKEVEIVECIFNSNKFQSHFISEKNKRFGIKENINDEIYKIKLEIDPCIKKDIEEYFWHISQNLFTSENGNLLMTLECGINCELVNWILEWGQNMKVIQPVLLINCIRAKLDAISNNYNSVSLHPSKKIESSIYITTH